MHGNITFMVSHPVITQVKGTLTVNEATIQTLEKDFSTAIIHLSINAASINTGNAERDEHLRSDEYLYTAQFPEIIFSSIGMGKPDETGLRELWGDLTIKGITNKVCLSVHVGGIARDTTGIEKAGFHISGKINRSNWGLKWNRELKTGNILVDETLEIICEIELTNIGYQRTGYEPDRISQNKVQ